MNGKELKIKKIIVGKIKLSQAEANYCFEISPKYAIWIARQIKDFKLSLKNNNVLNTIKHIIKWKKEHPMFNLNMLNYEQAMTKVSNVKKEDFAIISTSSIHSKQIIANCRELKWVKLKSAKAIQEEGIKMHNCLKDNYNEEEYEEYNDENDETIKFKNNNFFNEYVEQVRDKTIEIYSLRDKFNKPKVTVACYLYEYNFQRKKIKTASIESAYQKCNEPVASKYIIPLLILLCSLNKKNDYIEISSIRTSNLNNILAIMRQMLTDGKLLPYYIKHFEPFVPPNLFIKFIKNYFNNPTIKPEDKTQLKTHNKCFLIFMQQYRAYKKEKHNATKKKV